MSTAQQAQQAPTVAGPFAASLNQFVPESKVPWFEAGFLGVIVVNRCLWKTIRAGGNALIVEFTVESCAKTGRFPPPVGAAPGTLGPIDDTPPGSQRSWFQSMKEERTGWDSASLFLYAAMGYDPNSVKVKQEVEPKRADLLNAAVSAANILKAQRVMLETALIKTKKGTDFTKYIFSVAPPIVGQ